MVKSISLAKVWFIISIVLISFAYGFASHAWSLFPQGVVDRAYDQFQNLYSHGPNNPYMLSETFYERNGVDVIKHNEMAKGLTFVTSFWKDSTEFRLIDGKGQTVHKWPVNRGNLFAKAGRRAGSATSRTIHGSRLLRNGDVVFNVEYAGMARINSCGDVIWTLREGNHHSLSQTEDGTFWTSGVSSKPRRKSEKYPGGYPGIDKPVWIEYALHVDGEGSVIDRINILDVIYNSKISHIVRETLYHHSGRDVTHMNDVEELGSSMSDEYPLFDSGDLLVSLLGMNLVFVFDPGNGEVKWHTTNRFAMQHDPDFVGDGKISVYDNNTNWNGSRIVEFIPHLDSSRVKISSKDIDGFFSGVRGKHQTLENGNLLLTETTRARLLEVNPSGEIVWEWIKKPNDNYVASVIQGYRYNITKRDVKSWRCSSVESIRNYNSN